MPLSNLMLRALPYFLFSAFAGSMAASPITYKIVVNTSPLAGVNGSLDFNFNPGPLTTQLANVQLSISGNGLLSSAPSTVGDVTGTFPGTVAVDNGAGFNDYFQPFQFGSALAVNVTLSGPALIAPDGISTSGSTFAFSMFSDPAGTLPALTTAPATGFAYTIAVNLDGSTTPASFLPQQTAPEPATALLILGAMGFVLVAKTSLRVRRR